MLLRPLGAALVLLACAACPGSLANPDRFLGADGGPTCDVEGDIFQMQCALSGCHDATSQTQGLDLASPGVKARLAGLATCASASTTPLATFLLQKVKPSPTCGGQMPVGAPALDASELRCLEAYLAALDGGTP